MKIDSIIEAWKDEEVHDSLSAEQRTLLAEHPAGPITEITAKQLAEVGGGALSITTSSWICGVIVTVTVCDELVEFFNDMEPGEPGKTLYCFAASTPVLTPNGHRPIHSLSHGDQVLAFDSEAGAVREAHVQDLDVHHGNFPVLDLRAGGEQVEVTPGHVFHGREGWAQVERLREKDCLDSRERSQRVTLQGVRQTSAVYNLKVEGLASYYVGQADLLVRDH